MKASTVVSLVLFIFVLRESVTLNIKSPNNYSPCNTLTEDDRHPSLQKQSRWPNLIPDQALPANFTWANKDGLNFLTRVHNQKNPTACSACWIQAVVSAMSDRIGVMRKGAYPSITLTAQVSLTCDMTNNGCFGGSHVKALEWIKNNNVTDESCAGYYGKDYHNGLTCTEMAYCQDGPWFDEFEIAKGYTNYTIEDYGNLPTGDVASIMQEIFQNGPVVCGINGQAIENFKGDSIFATDVSGEITHAVTIVGWGESTTKEPYWIVRNSYGEEWGDRGFMKLHRGNNTLQIEEVCSWLTPKNTWDEASSTNKKIKELNQKKKTLRRKFPN